LHLAAAARAVLAELMLRGPQTAGELRNRAERMAEIADLAAVEAILLELQQCGPPLVIRLPRQAGRKDQRYAQVFAGMPEFPEEEEPEIERPALEKVTRGAGQAPGNERLVRLEEEVGTLRSEIVELRKELEEMIASFQ
jgi:uncharacterized protein YceH (UPF0502 family)